MSKLSRSAKVFITIGSVIVGLAIIAACVLWGFVVYYSPQRIARLIEEKSPEYLNAEISIGNLDYKLFKSYPWLEVEVDSLTIISRSLDNLPAQLKEELPPNSDFLASVASLKAKVNIKELVHDKIHLKDVEITRPKVNLVMVSDSIANFYIMKSVPHISKTPEFQISEINIEAPTLVAFTSLQDGITADLDLETFRLESRDFKNYDLSLKAAVGGSYKEYSLPTKIPVALISSMEVSPKDVELHLRKMNIKIIGVDILTDCDVSVNKNGIDIHRFNLLLKINDLFPLISRLPHQIAEKIQLPEGISGNLPIDFDVNFKSPMHINLKDPESLSLNSLPPMSANLKIPDANLAMTPPSGKIVTANDIFLDVNFDYDPEAPQSTRLSLNELRMHGEGISLDASAQINDLLGESQSFEGKVSFSSPVMETLSYFLPNSAAKIKGFLKGDMEVTGTALDLGKNGFKDISLNGDVHSRSLLVTSGKSTSLALRNMKGKISANVPGYPLNDYKGTLMNLDLVSDSMVLKNNGSNVRIGRLSLMLDAMDTVSGNPKPNGKFDVKLNSLRASSPGIEFNASMVDFKTTGALRTSSSSSPSVPDYEGGKDDEIIADRIDHTPLELEYEGGGIMQTVINMVNVICEGTVTNGYFRSDSYLYPVEFSNLFVSTDLNRWNLTLNNAKIDDTGFSLKADARGIGDFLTSYEATPLHLSADIDFSNVDINRLARGYYAPLIKKVGVDSAYYIAPLKPFTKADSVCVAIPRNISADIRLKSQSAEYMQYRFSPLSTRIIVNDGAATLKDLTVGAPYCTAVVDWTYSTTNLGNIFMDLKADVKNFNFQPFYNVFPSLVEKAPELKNLSGDLNALVECRFDMFPNMFMNAESLRGVFDIKGSQMEFARDGKIEKITHLMLIDGDQPIRIENFNITGAYHDNLLQLNPFRLNFDNYQLAFAGVNNTQGDMYYHIALEKSPFHLPFGVSLKGKFSHPEIRLGGTHIDDFDAEKVSSEVTTPLNLNIMAWLRRGWLMFVQEAAKYDESR